MKKNILIGFLLSILFAFLSFREISLPQVIAGTHKIFYGYAFAAMGAMFIVQVLRSLRWGRILRPVQKIAPLSLFPITCVGFLATAAIPARVGELVRPYLIARNREVEMATALGTIFVERLCDSLTIFFLLAALLLFTPVPNWLFHSGIFLLALTLLMTAGIITICIIKEEYIFKIINFSLQWLPKSWVNKIHLLLQQFLLGLKIMIDIKEVIQILLYSLVIWSINAGAIYLLFLAFNFTLPLVASVILMAILIVGIAIPAGPGFIGNWHYSCLLGLSLYGVPKPDALSFAVIYHFLSIGIVIFLGSIFLPFSGFSLSAFWNHIKNRPPAN